MTDGWTSAGGLGLGLSAPERLVNDFAIELRLDRERTVTHRAVEVAVAMPPSRHCVTMI